MESLREHLERGEIILLDGPTSTEIERRGVRMDSVLWSAVAHMTHPDIVRAVHADYIRAGAQVIIANTFSTARHMLAASGREDETASINRRAVEIAREARTEAAQGPVWIAGSMSSMSPFTDQRTTPHGPKAAASYREQAEILAAAGADLLITEMMIDIENATLVTEAALATGLPVWHGFSADLMPDGRLLEWREIALEDLPAHEIEPLIRDITALGGEAAGIMHSFPEAILPGLAATRRHWSGPMLAYAETGKLEGADWNFSAAISPEDYAEAALGWVAAGAQIVGSCCGTGLEHIRRLKARLPARRT